MTPIPNPNLFTKLSVLTYGNGFTLFHFKGSPGSVGDPVWWETFKNMVKPGDVVMATSPQGAVFWHRGPEGMTALAGTPEQERA